MDLDIKDLSELLGVSEITIKQWLVEGRIPFYRMEEQYRFSRPEIDNWLMEKQFQSGSSQVKAGHRQYHLYRALHKGSVWAPEKEMSKEEIICWTMHQMARNFELDPDVLSELFLDRERMAPTALGHGIAVPHTRDFLLNRHFDVIEVVYPKTPMIYGALDNQPVHTLFFLFASEDKQHLHILAKLAHLCSSETTRAFLASKPSKEKLLEHVKGYES